MYLPIYVKLTLRMGLSDRLRRTVTSRVTALKSVQI